jgi:hypothetical protein
VVEAHEAHISWAATGGALGDVVAVILEERINERCAANARAGAASWESSRSASSWVGKYGPRNR